MAGPTPSPPQPFPPPAAAVLPSFDEQAFLGRILGNRQAAARILDTFLGSVPAVLARLQAAMAAGDLEGAGKDLHLLAGSSATVSGEALRACAQALEQALRAGDAAQVEAGLPALQDEHERFKAAVREFRA